MENRAGDGQIWEGKGRGKGDWKGNRKVTGCDGEGRKRRRREGVI